MTIQYTNDIATDDPLSINNQEINQNYVNEEEIEEVPNVI